MNTEDNYSFPVAQNYDKQGILYFDSASTNLKPKIVTDEIAFFHLNHTSNIHRAIHKIANDNTNKYETVRKKIALLINASPKEVIFTSGSTEGINIVAKGLDLDSESEIIISSVEHHANIVPWLAVGAKIKIWDISNGDCDLVELEKLINRNTKLIAITALSNVTGNYSELEEIMSVAKKYDLITLIDASQIVAHKEIDSAKLNCDFIVFSAHKMFGPSGVGVLYINNDTKCDLKISKYGGGAVNKVDYNQFTLKEKPYCYEVGTPNIENILGFGKAADFIFNIGYNNIEKKLIELDFCFKELILKKLAETCFVINSAHAPIFPIVFPNSVIPLHILATILSNDFNIILNYGFQCAQPLYNSKNLNGSIRLSLSIYNSCKQIEQLAEILRNNRTIFN